MTAELTRPPPLLRPRGSNHVGMRQFNERVVLQAIRQNGSLPKADLARLTGLTAQTVGLITTRLEDDGLVMRQERVRGRIGQPSVPLALNPDGAAEATTYVISWAKYQMDSSSDIAGHALVDAAPDTTAAPYPLVVFSHGWGSEDIFYAWLVEHLASYGFVVVGPDHQEFTDETSSDLVRTTVDRPYAITHTIDYAATLTAPDGALAGLIDMERIAVAGQSYGGYTALAAAGARYDMNAYAARCAGLAPARSWPTVSKASTMPSCGAIPWPPCWTAAWAADCAARSRMRRSCARRFTAPAS